MDARVKPAHDAVVCCSCGAYAASTSTSSESSSAVIFSFASSRIAAPSRALTPHAVDLDRAGRRHQIEVARLARRIFRALAGLQRGGEHARVGADRQRVVVAVEAAGEGDELAGAVRLRERLGAPGRLAALRGRLDPDLEDPRRGSAPDCIRSDGCRSRRSSPARRRLRCGPCCRGCPDA